MRTTRIDSAEADPTEINTAAASKLILRTIPRNMTPPLTLAAFDATLATKIRSPTRDDTRRFEAKLRYVPCEMNAVPELSG